MISGKVLSVTALILMAGFCMVYAQNDSPAIGVDFGSGIVQATPFQTISLSEGESTGALVPKNVRGRFELPMNENVVLRFAGGYGSTTEKYEAEAADGGASFTEELEIKVSGFPIDGAILFQAPIGANGAVNIRGGIGIGFYSYNVTAEYSSQQTAGGQTFTETFELPDTKISGLAQSFILGFTINISSSISGVLELSKMGFSMIKVTQDIENDEGNAIGEWKVDHNAANGLDDLGVLMGINFHLGG